MYLSDYDYLSAFLSDKSKAENNFITLPYRSLLSKASTMNLAQWLSLVCQLSYFCLLAAAIYSSCRLLRRRRYRQLFLPLFILIGGSLAIILVMHGETRFKDPFMPFLFMLAPAFLLYSSKKVR